MSEPVVLVVDDDRANLESVARIFQKEGVATLTATSGQEAMDFLRRPEVAVLVTDLMMPGMDGGELLRAARAMRPDVEVVLMTAYGTVETAVAAMKDGAYDFITKPLKRHSLVKAVQKALERQALVAENKNLKERLADLGAPGGRTIVGQAPAFRAFMGTLRQAGPAPPPPVLVRGAGPGVPGLHGHHPAGGAVLRHRAADRRVRHRQGAGGARDPRAVVESEGPVRGGERGGAPGDDPRSRALRRRTRRVHRRERAPRG